MRIEGNLLIGIKQGYSEPIVEKIEYFSEQGKVYYLRELDDNKYEFVSDFEIDCGKRVLEDYIINRLNND